MKKLIFVLFIFIFCINIFSQEAEKIDAQWIKIKRTVRKNFEKFDKVELDKQTLEAIDKSNLDKEIEKEVSILLQEIIEDSTLYGKENAIKAIRLLYSKLQDKKHFFDIAAEFCYDHPVNFPHIISKFFEGLTINIDGHYEENMKSLKVVYEAIRPTYISTNNGGEVQYGTDTVIIHMIEYLREYIKLVDQGKITEDPKYKYLISYMYRDLGLNEATSNFKNLPGAQELKEEYFFLQEKSKEDNN